MFQDAVWNAVCSGEINTIGTDHVANQIKSKLDGTYEDGVWGALAGFPGIGTSLPVLASRGVNEGKLSLERLANLTSSNAAKILYKGHFAYTTVFMSSIAISASDAAYGLWSHILDERLSVAASPFWFFSIAVHSTRARLVIFSMDKYSQNFPSFATTLV